MNKVQVGATPSPNLKAIRSKIGSLENATHRPGGGNVKIESKKVEVKAAPRIAARNDQYVPGGGDKKVSRRGRERDNIFIEYDDEMMLLFIISPAIHSTMKLAIVFWNTYLNRYLLAL